MTTREIAVPEEKIERKLAAILCADVVGYSRLMGEDDAATLRMLTEYREVFFQQIDRFRGHLVNAPGDSILAEFTSALEAVECAIAVQQELEARNKPRDEARKMRFRIGINLGDVIVADSGIYGDGVNIASRLEALAKPGGVCISAAVYEQVRQRIGLLMESMGDQQLKNISATVRAYQMMPGMEGEAFQPEDMAREPGTAIEYPGVPKKPSIAVLAFDNMSADPDQEFFSEGISEDIITDLSKISGLMVIARHSSFSYKNTNTPIPQIGKELGVSYVLEGSVRKSANHARITAKLVSAETGQPVWAERYDRDLTDIFAVQDEITSEIVTALNVNLLSGEQARVWGKSLKNPKARELYYQALSPWDSQNKDEMRAARELFSQVMALEPESPLGYARAAWSLLIETLMGYSANPPQTIAEAHEFAQKALARDDQNGDALSVVGLVNVFQREHGKAVEMGARAVELSPNSADVIIAHGFILLFSGMFEDALQHIERAIRLCPVAPAFYFNVYGVCLRELHRYDDAVASLKKSIALRPGIMTSRFALISVLCAMDKGEQADAVHKEILAIAPGFSIEAYARRLPFSDPAVNETMVQNMTRAGLIG